ncbi:uncharacterized protein LOC132613184 [Lycium barbarum]|uniref:uncharacterized protein LOC132613184 n=1 Tax=Lycium barbarum TaxID=112863 RepID=UPI00293F1CDF|nr:uncharacterized protein LOC132613184 [Lycium barbarum]
MESGELNCESSDLRISYMINALPTRGKTHLSFITNDRQVVLYMLDVAADGPRPVLRINVVERSQVGSTSVAPPLPTDAPLPQSAADETSKPHEGMGDHFMDMDDPNIDDEECDGNDGGDGQPPSGSQSNHNFNDGIGFYCGQLRTKSFGICISLDDADRFKYYFVAYKACIQGYKHIQKVITIDGTHLYGKYEGVLLSAVALVTENHIYPIAFCVADKECDESWIYFFEQLSYLIADEPYLCIISDRHKSIANGVSRIFEHAHHGLCMKHLGDSLRKKIQRGDSLHVYYDTAKAYGYQEFNEHFQQLRDKCPQAANCLEFDIGFEKWSKAYFPANRYDMLTINIVESLNSILRDEGEYPVTALVTSISRRFAEIFRQRRADISSLINLFVPSAEKTLREKMNEGDSLFVNNINGDANEFTVVCNGLTAKVNLLNKTCTCRECDLVKLPCAHVIIALRLKYGPHYDSSIYEYSSPMYKVQSYILALVKLLM